ncbi:MAG TPA: high-potential iron-sulfur protein [Woeseiaceae bacterium]|nr:high-potential iron-sulfur protein [Woeseiaceae bacterium]
MSKIARRQFIQLSAVAAAGCFIRPGTPAAQEMEKLDPASQQAKALHYTHDSSTVDPASRPQPAKEQHCGNCALVQADEGEWRGCQIFPGKLVNQNGWCSVWSPKPQ